MPFDMEDRDVLRRELESAVSTLLKHFDTVQIFVTVHQKEGEMEQTLDMKDGSGNWYARFGQVRSWLIFQESNEARGASQVKDEDDNDEEES